MRISFVSSYLSIQEFPTVEVPQFCLITGENGAGKSHLLQALQTGRLKTDVAPQQAGKDPLIKLFTLSDINLEGEKNYSSDVSERRVAEIASRYHSTKTGVAFEGRRRRHPNQPSVVQDPSQSLLARLDQETREFCVAAAANSAKTVINLDTNDFTKLLSAPTDFTRLGSVWGEPELFRQSFAKLFGLYRDLWLANSFRAFLVHSRVSSEAALSEDDFRRDYGTPPWESVNDAFANAELDFEINSPYLYDKVIYEPQLFKRSTGVNVPFSGLSSGEKILASLICSSYYSDESRQRLKRPDLLLLDEIDAPLHPSVAKKYLAVIQAIFVQKLGMHVIAVTHSPTTIALAPENSIFTMRLDRAGICPTPRAQAIELLTVGVPTLSISFEGRRQVFAESPIDAKLFDRAYQILKPTLASERSLNFIPTGFRSKSGDVNTGREVVTTVVGNLVQAGNRTALGLIDWDGTNISSGNILVLAEGRRNGLENLLLDPLLVALIVLRLFPQFKSQIDAPKDVGYSALRGSLSSPELAQPIVNTIVQTAIAAPTATDVELRYMDGLTLRCDKRYLCMDDHRLEDTLLNKFPFLRASARSAGDLMRCALDILDDISAATPCDLLETFTALLTHPT